MQFQDVEKLEGCVAKITLDTGRVLIGSITTDARYEYIHIGHPVDETGDCTCGSDNMNVSYLDKIEPITGEQFAEWKVSYEKFHKEILEEKGYDSCSENVSALRFYSENMMLANIRRMTHEIINQ